MTRNTVAAMVCAFALLVSSPVSVAQQPGVVDRPGVSPTVQLRKVFVPRQLRIQFAEGVTDAMARAFVRGLGLQVVRPTQTDRLYIVRAAEGADLWTLARRVNTSPLVVYAVPDFVLMRAPQPPVGPLPPRQPHPSN